MTNRPVLIIFLQLGIGGVQRKIVDIVNYLGDKKPELPVYILLRNRTDFDMGSEITNKQVVVINYADWVKKIPIRVRFFFPFFVLIQVWRFNPRSILAFLDFCSLPALVAKKVLFWRRIKVVLSEDHFASGVLAVQVWSQFRNWLIKVFYPWADVVFTCSEANKCDLVNNYHLSSNKVSVLVNWTKYAYYRVAKVKKVYDLIYVGRLEKTKNLPFLLEVIKLEKSKLHRRLSVCILGEGKERVSLENLASRLGIADQIEWVNSRLDVDQYIRKSKILVYCSWYQVEGLPLAILEAMALGVPVLTRSFAGAKEFLVDNNNCHVANTKVDFIKRVELLLDNPSEYSRIAYKAREYVIEKHSMKNIDGYLRALDCFSE